MNNLQLKKRIMRKIYAIYAFRKVFSNMAFKIYTGLILIYAIKVFVHVEAVANNMLKLSDLSGLYNFMSDSVLNTELSVQLIIVGVFGLIVWTMRDFIRKYLYKYNNSTIQNQAHI